MGQFCFTRNIYAIQTTESQNTCITFLAEDERIVDPDRINDRMKIWPAGVLHFMQSARHEVLMEDIVTQEYITQKIANFFKANNDLVTD